jgi:hypothetical protein
MATPQTLWFYIVVRCLHDGMGSLFRRRGLRMKDPTEGLPMSQTEWLMSQLNLHRKNLCGNLR